MIPLSLCPPATSRAWPQLHQEEVARRQWAGEPHRWCFLPWALTCRQLLPIQRVAQWDGRRYPRYHLTPCHPLIKHHLHPHTWLIPPSDCVCSPHFPPRFSCCHWWCGIPHQTPTPPIYCPCSSACLSRNKRSCTKTKLDLMTNLYIDNKCLKTMIIYPLSSSDEVHPCQSERFSLCCFWQKSSNSASQASHYPQWRKTPETSNMLHLRPNIWGSIFSHPHPINTTVIGNHSLTWSRDSRACITSIAPSSSL